MNVSSYDEGMYVRNSGSEPSKSSLDTQNGWVHLYGSVAVPLNNCKEINFKEYYFY